MRGPAYHLEGGTVQLAALDHIEPPKNDLMDLEIMRKMMHLNMVSTSTVITQLKKHGVMPEETPKGLTIKDMTADFAKNHWGVLALQEFDFKPAVIFMVANCDSMSDFIRQARKTVKGKMGAIFSKAKDDSIMENKPIFIALESREDGALFKLFFG